MAFFKEIEGEGAIIQEGGVFRQVPLFERDGYIFAKLNGGFVRLMADGSTSKAGGKMRLDFMSFDGGLYRDALGRLCRGSVAGAVALDTKHQQLLLGASS
jgi:hypothetical protein